MNKAITVDVKHLRLKVLEQISNMEKVQGYNPIRLKNLIHNTDDSSLAQTISNLILSGNTDGFTNLILADKSQYTLERLILDEFKDDFSQEVINNCKRKLG